VVSEKQKASPRGEAFSLFPLYIQNTKWRV
jgi:hypothetical protein